MRAVWIAALLMGIAVAVPAYADTVYLKDGQILWAPEVFEEGQTVVVLRPSGKVVVPRADVEKIERARISMPRYYEPPAQDTAKPQAPAATTPAAPGAPPTAPPPPPPVAAAPDAPRPAPEAVPQPAAGQ